MLKSLIRRKSSASPPDISAPQSSRASGVIEQRDQQRDHASAGHSSKSTRKADTIVVLDNSYSMRLRLPAAKALLRYLAHDESTRMPAATGQTCAAHVNLQLCSTAAGALGLRGRPCGDCRQVLGSQSEEARPPPTTSTVCARVRVCACAADFPHLARVRACR